MDSFFQFKPIGYFHSIFQYKNGTPRQPSVCSAARGSLTLEKNVFNNPQHALEGLEQFSHAWILFVFHKNKQGHTKAKVKPPRLNGQRVGVFSTRSPYRPNAIGLTLAKIEQISDSTVHFSGIDLVDGTPVLDIKPFIPDYDAPVARCRETDGQSGVGVSVVDRSGQARCSTSDTSALEDVIDSGRNKNEAGLKENQSFTASSEDIDGPPPVWINGKYSENVPSSGTFTSLDAADSPQAVDVHAHLPTLVGLREKTTDCDLVTAVTNSRGPVSTREAASGNRDQSSLHEVSSPGSERSTEATVAKWLSSPPVSKLAVSFTPRAEDELGRLVAKHKAAATLGDFQLEFLTDEDDLRAAIVSVLAEDPRSVYRREKCGDYLYFFTVDRLHVTCWFDELRAEVLRVQPLSQASKLGAR